MTSRTTKGQLPLPPYARQLLARLERGDGNPSPLVERKLRAWIGDSVGPDALEERISALESVVFGGDPEPNQRHDGGRHEDVRDR